MATYGHTFTSGDTLTPTKLNAARTATDIVNADIKSDAAIAGTKIAPNFGAQNIVTDGTSFVESTSTVQRGSNISGSTANLMLQKQRAGGAAVQAADGLGQVIFKGQDGTNFINAATIAAQVDGTPGTNDMPGRLVFSTTADGGSSVTERMRITSGGAVLVAKTTNNTLDGGCVLDASGVGIFVRDGNVCVLANRLNTSGDAVQLRQNNVNVGSISVTGVATAYNTSSDYRLKENATPLTGGLALIEQVRPVKFDWKGLNEKGRGFIAHELQAVVPEAVTGEKDAVDAEGNPQYQGVDAAKIVPLLVAAVQELSAKVAALEAAR